MARRYTRRYSRRRKYSRRSGRSMARVLREVKRDALEVTFPKKFKFIKLPERKTMFLYHTETLALGNSTTEGEFSGRQMVLYPTLSSNMTSLMSKVNLGTTTNTNNVRIGNWDKMCILAVYITVQPDKNTYTGGSGNSIVPVSCFYAINNNVAMPDQAGVPNSNISEAIANAYDLSAFNYKHIFTFNSNETCTFVLRSPSTMATDSPKIHGKRAWWSLADQTIFSINANNGWQEKKKSIMDEESQDEECEYIHDEYGILNSPYYNRGIAPAVHCGRLYFAAKSPCSFTVTINYKVALRG